LKLSFTTFACPQWSLDRALTAAVRHGYEGIELRIDAGHQHGVEVATTTKQRMDIRHTLAEVGVQPCCLATSLQFTTDGVVDQAKARIELAAEIGCPGLRVLGGPIKTRAPIEDLINQAGQQLHQAAQLADQAGIELWLETHDVFSKGADAAAVVRAADHPAVGIVYNNRNPYCHGEALDVTIDVLQGLVRYTHFHDAAHSPDQLIIRPFGKGDLPIGEMYQALTAMGYDGYLGGEWFYDQYGPTPDRSLHTYYQDVNTLMRRHRRDKGTAA
jgi:sugar phosphate isomerase/epimerase